MMVRRLGWAGIQVSSGSEAIVIDYVHGTPMLRKALPEAAFARPADAPVPSAALVTHLHADHTDVGAIKSAIGDRGIVLRPRPFKGTAKEGAWTIDQERALSASDLDVRIVDDWDHAHFRSLEVTAVPAVDGLGDPQVNWVIEADGQRVFHGGDTIFHGHWWLIAGRLGPIDVAVLPINGAFVDFPHMQPPSPVPAVMTPDQAARAAYILGAKTIVPIHFGVDQPPYYAEQPDLIANLKSAASALSLRAAFLEPGDVLDLAELPAA
jgi:L-ascorbate metabolism protein UlaG (beta-lactamase superfamily)